MTEPEPPVSPFHTNGEIVAGPDGDIVVPITVEGLRPDGFMVRLDQADQIALEMLASTEGTSKSHVITRLLFTSHEFQRLVAGLCAVRDELAAGPS